MPVDGSAVVTFLCPNFFPSFLPFPHITCELTADGALRWRLARWRRAPARPGPFVPIRLGRRRHRRMPRGPIRIAPTRQQYASLTLDDDDWDLAPIEPTRGSAPARRPAKEKRISSRKHDGSACKCTSTDWVVCVVAATVISAGLLLAPAFAWTGEPNPTKAGSEKTHPVKRTQVQESCPCHLRRRFANFQRQRGPADPRESVFRADGPFMLSEYGFTSHTSFTLQSRFRTERRTHITTHNGE